MRKDIKRIGKSFSISLIAQMISSATNFGISMYLVRNCEKEQFGLYGLAFATILTFSGFSSSFISVQLVVNLPNKEPKIRSIYEIDHVALVILFGIVVLSIGVLINTLFKNVNIGKINISHFCFPISLGIAFYSLRDIFARIAYSEKKEYIVLITSIFVALGVVIGFVVIKILNLILFAKNALYIYSLGQVVGSIIAGYLLGLPWKKVSLKGIEQALKDCLKGGKWNVLISILYHIRTQLHNFIIGPVLGPNKLAEVNAARILITPAILAIPPLTQVLLPRLAFQRTKSKIAFKKGIYFSILSLVIIVLLYILFLIISFPWVTPLILGHKYHNVKVYVVLWSVVAFFLAIRNGLNIGCQAMLAFDKLFFINIFLTIFGIFISTILVYKFQAVGVIISICIMEFLFCIALSILSWYKIR